MFRFTHLLQQNIQQRPQQEATRCLGQSQSYAALGERVARLAGGLQAQGMQQGDRVAMLSLNSPAYLEYLFAVPWGGGVLNPVNIRWSAAEIAYSLEDSGTRLLLVDAQFLPLVDEVRRLAPVVETVIVVGVSEAPTNTMAYEALIAQSQPVADAGRCNDDLLGVFYTGGTTGFPKGVMLSHTNIVTSAMSLAIPLGLPDDGRYLHAAPMFHLADLAMTVVGFLRGYTHVIIPAFDPVAVRQAIAAEQVTDTLLVPTMVQMVLDAPGFDAAQVSSLQRILYGASPMPQATIEKAMTLMPHVQFYQAYGMTELAPLATVSPPGNHTVEGIESGLIRSAGRAGPLQAVRVVDEQQRELPRGETGQVVVRGPNVMSGYWQNPEATAEAIVDGWLQTGDVGRMDEAGWLYIVDRSKDMIITGGENVYSAEVESVLSQHPDIAQVAVIAVPSEAWGEAVHAVIVPVPDAELTIESVRAFCQQHIAGYKCPRSLSFIDALPLSGAGKVLKTELRKPYWGE